MNQVCSNAYALISPARNEAAFLPALIDSVVRQSVLPRNWVIVSDGSTDKTDEIVCEAVRRYGFIKFIRNQATAERNFGAKARAFQKGYIALKDVEFDFIGNLDADVTFGRDYYARMLDEMHKNPRLGVASGVCWDKTADGFKLVTISLNHAVGAVQFFRRECFEAVGGYRPATVGGVDSLAELTARMKGWQTQAFPELPVYHHKPVDSANARTGVKICYRAGLTEYYIGTHPLFAIAKAIRRWREAPVGLSPFIRLFAYLRLWLSGSERDAPEELVAYLRREQLEILKQRLLCRNSGDCCAPRASSPGNSFP